MKQSNQRAEWLRSVLGVGAAPDIHWVYNGIDLDVFRPRANEPAEPLLLAVGRLVEKKGFADLIRACHRLVCRGVGMRCEIVGAGPLERSLRRLVEDLGLGDTVRLRGALPQEEVRVLYERAMVFALPCRVGADGDRDVLPNVLKEAMAVGVPVVTSRIPGIGELVDHGTNGLLHEPGDVEGIADRIEELLGDAALRRRIAAGARRTIEERFDRTRSFTTLRRLLANVEERVEPECADELREAV